MNENNQENETAYSDASFNSEPAYRYNARLAQDIERRWQKFWDEQGTFWAANVNGKLTDAQGKNAEGRPSFFAMDMFPYPSGKGLHVGHPLGYLATDVVSRYHRMKGENVLHAMGYDAFGLPAEQYAVQTGQHPRITTEANIANMKRQLHRMGLSFDARRSFATIDPEYVRWTQWIFSKLYDAWYDESYVRADGGKGSARPISTLIESFENKTRAIPGFSGKAWQDLSKAEQADVLNDFRLAYISKSPVNWCPGLGTVLANEEVTAEGRSERGNFPVFQRHLRQWSMRITAYGSRLVEDLDTIDWPEKVKLMQRNWIGKSHGAHIHFQVPCADGQTRDLEVYTTRPDTIFGTTFAVVSVDHPLLHHVPEAWDDDVPEAWKGGFANLSEGLEQYRKTTHAKRAKDRTQDADKKTGLFTGLYAINPVTGVKLPIFASDYVLMDYGTGAIMAVPGGDQRDYDFATSFDLPVVYTVQPLPESGENLADYEGKAPFVGHDGTVINSAIDSTYTLHDSLDINGLAVEDAAQKVNAWLAKAGVGEGTISYRLRDWLFSRQRYWGEPFPIVYDEDGVAHLVPESQLPIALPDVPDYQPKTFEPDDADSQPEAPLSRNEDWVKVRMDLGEGEKTYYRDTNTMPNWAGSCWYYLRYLDPTSDKQLVDSQEYNYWMGVKPGELPGKAGGVDLYVGGVEHAVLHLLYARFWHKALYDLGYVGTAEPFYRLFNQGMIQAYAYTDERGQYVPASQVVEGEPDEHGEPTFSYEGKPAYREFGKMGKSLKNIVTPDDMYDNYGADTFRLYEMSMGPLAESRPWNTKNVVGGMRFLQRLWRNVVDETTGACVVSEDGLDEKTLRLLNNTIAEVTVEMEAMRPNTAIAKLIVLNNHLTSLNTTPRSAVEPLVLMLAPIAPHICEELWQKLGHNTSIAHAQWPQADTRYVGVDKVVAVVQVKGKVRAKLDVDPNISAQDLEQLALQAVADRLGGKAPRKVICKPPKIVSIVPDES